MKNRKEQVRKAVSPVEDGDTRPDMQPAGRDIQQTLTNEDTTGRVTKERGADTNSLEDYKDGKENIGSPPQKEAQDATTSAVPKPDHP